MEWTVIMMNALAAILRQRRTRTKANSQTQRSFESWGKIYSMDSSNEREKKTLTDGQYK